MVYTQWLCRIDLRQRGNMNTNYFDHNHTKSRCKFWKSTIFDTKCQPCRKIIRCLRRVLSSGMRGRNKLLPHPKLKNNTTAETSASCLIYSLILKMEAWGHYIPQKCGQTSIRLHSITPQKTVLFTDTPERTSNLTIHSLHWVLARV
jgi:hypothetical protein